jgi:hypothetical protein
MRKALVSLLVVAGLVGLAVVTNPSAERHRAKIREATAERSPVAGLFGLGALAAFVSTYHPLGVVSYTTVDDQVVSIGAFGMVFVKTPTLPKKP